MKREEAIQRFNGIINAMSISVAQSKFYPSKAELDELCDMAISVLSADAVQGEWIDMEIHCNPYPPIFCVECSRCGYRVGRETFLENTFNFCPSCGARMENTK